MLWLKMSVGALIVLIVQLLTQTRFFYIAALVPLFPSFALISHFLVATQRSAADFKVAIVFSMLGVIPHLMYSLTVLLCIDYMNLLSALLIGVIAWLIGASVLVLAWQAIQV